MARAHTQSCSEYFATLTKTESRTTQPLSIWCRRRNWPHFTSRRQPQTKATRMCAETFHCMHLCRDDSVCVYTDGAMYQRLPFLPFRMLTVRSLRGSITKLEMRNNWTSTGCAVTNELVGTTAHPLRGLRRPSVKSTVMIDRPRMRRPIQHRSVRRYGHTHSRDGHPLIIETKNGRRLGVERNADVVIPLPASPPMPPVPRWGTDQRHSRGPR